MKLNLNNSRVALRSTSRILPLLLAVTLPVAVSAQSLTFAFAKTILPTPNNVFSVNAASSVAVDGAGNVYFSVGSQLLKVPPGGGLPVLVASGANASAIAVDASGNVFYSVGSKVLEAPVGGGTPISVGTGLVSPGGLAVDHQQNLYIADSGAAALWKIAGDGAGAQSKVSLTGITAPGDVAVDAAGDLFVTGNGVLVEVPANGSGQSVIATGLSTVLAVAADAAGDVFAGGYIGSLQKPPPPYIVDEIVEIPAGGGTPQILLNSELYLGQAGQLAADSQGNVYLSYSYSSGIVELQRTGSVNFGNVNVCGGQIGPVPCGATAYLFYNVTAGGIFGGGMAVNKGTGGDFQTQVSACSGTLTAGSTCFVQVSFTPSVPNQQSGTVQVLDGSGNLLNTVAIEGNGLGVTNFLSPPSGPPAGSLRNNYSGFVGFQFTVGAAPIEVFSLGRFVAPGNTGTHLLKLVQANGTDVPGASVTLPTVFQNAGVFAVSSDGDYLYAELANPVTLATGTSYYLVSQETAGGDAWYDIAPVTSSPDATVVGPTYTDGGNHFVTVGGFGGSTYVPVNFQYFLGSSTAISVSITSPAAGASVSGLVPITVAASSLVTSLQAQVDGTNQGSAVPVNTGLSLDTSKLTTGTHSLTVVASDAQSQTVTSAPVSINVLNQTTAPASFVTGETPGPLRNNYTGLVGFSMTVGSSPLTISALGRYIAPGNSGVHLLKLVNSNGTDVAGGSAYVNLMSQPAGTIYYGYLNYPITLQPNTTYFLVSQETAGGDQWYNFGPVATTSVATVTAPVYTDGGGHYVQVSSFPGDSYVPLSFLYGGTTGNSLFVTITSPVAGAVVSGNNVQVNIGLYGGGYSSLQLQVDGISQGASVTGATLRFDSTVVGNGQHTLTVAVSGYGGQNAVSPGVSVTVNNTGVSSTPFIIGETPSTLRNNYSGYVGTQIQVGTTPLVVTALGRMVVSGNAAVHTVKLVQANGTDVPGGTVSVSPASGTAGTFVYGTLASPVTLLANTAYYLVSSETAGGDMWYNLEPVTATGAAQILGPTYTDGHGAYVTVPGLAGNSYVPVSFQYQ